jgi:hypothetical protein
VNPPLTGSCFSKNIDPITNNHKPHEEKQPMFSLKDLTELLDKMPIWRRMKAAPDRIDELEKRLKGIEDRMSGTGELCPYCKQPTLELIEIRPHAIFGDAGLKKHIYKCNNCSKPYEKDVKDF